MRSIRPLTDHRGTEERFCGSKWWLMVKELAGSEFSGSFSAGWPSCETTHSRFPPLATMYQETFPSGHSVNCPRVAQKHQPLMPYRQKDQHKLSHLLSFLFTPNRDLIQTCLLLLRMTTSVDCSQLTETDWIGLFSWQMPVLDLPQDCWTSSWLVEQRD